MKKIRFISAIYWLFIGIRFLPAQQTGFPSAQVRGDLSVLKKELIENHPNLFLYTPQADFEKYFSHLFQNVPDTLSENETYAFFAQTGSVIRDGHTLFFPPEKSTGFHNENSVFFPGKIYWDGNSMFLQLHFFDSSGIPDGARILSINGQSADTIMAFLLERMMYDGDNRTYPTWVLNNWFSEYYSYFYGHPESFEVEYNIKTGPIISTSIPALKKTEIAVNRQKNYPDKSFVPKIKDGISAQFNTELKTAVLTIRDFHNEILKNTYQQKFKKEIKIIFREIQKQKTENLILDLRNNQGGDVQNGKFLLSRICARRFQLVSAYYKVDKSSLSRGERKIRPAKGPAMRFVQPKKNAFSGRLYVLVNGGSFSNSGIVSSALQHDGRGIFIGDETGGNPHIICGNARSITLPNTGMQVEISTLRYVIRNPSENTGRGLMPEHRVRPTVDDLIAGRDVELELALDLIKKNR